MDDADRILEKKALRNVRTLFERLERDERVEGRRQWRLALIAVIPIMLFVGLIVVALKTRPPLAQASSCELDAWNARVAEFERDTRRSNPEMPYREIQARVERERPFLRAAAKIDCSSKSR